MTEYQGKFRGLASYREKDQALFKGRDHATRDLCRLIRRRRLTIVCGVPGVGKSSLLQAGVFPALRKERFLPIWIHLRFASGQRAGLVGDGEAAPHLIEQVRAAIEEVLRAAQVDAPLPAVGESLPDYFARTPLWGADYALLAPLLVFDQFEEVFTLGRKDRQAEVNQLVEMLGRICDQPSDEEPAAPEIEPPPARIVLGLREDYLAEIEEHRRSLRGLVDDRYRLTRLKGDDALAVVLASGLADLAIAEGIVRYVERENPVRAAEGAPLSELSIDPALLSLVCDELDRTRAVQGAAMLAVPPRRKDGDPARNSELAEFYRRAFAGRDPGLRVLVEEYLVDKEARTTCSRQHALEIPGVTEQGIKALTDEARIVREDSRFKTPHIELIHDVLVPHAVEGRREREESVRKDAFTRTVWRRVGLGVAVVVVAAVGYLYDSARRDEAEATRRNALAMQKESDTRVQAGGAVMAQVARDALERGDLAAAGNLLLEAKATFRSSSSAWTADHEVMLARAVNGLGDRVAAVDHGVAVIEARLDDSATRLETVGRDGSWRSWTLASPVGRADESVGRSAIDPELIVTSAAGNWIATVDATGAGEVRARDGRSRGKLPATRKTAAGEDPPSWKGCATGDGKAFALWDGVGPLQPWSVSGAEVKPVIVTRPLPAASAVACTAGGFVVATATGWATVSAAGQVSPLVAGTPMAPVAPAVELTASDDGQVVATRDVRGVVTLWRERAVVKLPRLTQPVARIQVSPDGTHLLALVTAPASNAGLIAVWTTTADARLVFAVQRDLWLRPRGESPARLANGFLIVNIGRVEVWTTGTWALQANLGRDNRPLGQVADVRRDRNNRLVIAFRTDSVVQVRRFDASQVDGDHQISPIESSSWVLGPAVSAPSAAGAGGVVPGLRRLRWSARGAMVVVLRDRTMVVTGSAVETVEVRAEDAMTSADGALWTCAETSCAAWRQPGVTAALVKLSSRAPRIAADGGSVVAGGKIYLLPPVPDAPIRRLAPRAVDWLAPVVGGWIAQQGSARTMLTEQGNAPLPGPGTATAGPYVSDDGDWVALAHDNQVALGTVGALRSKQATSVTLGTAPLIAMTGRGSDTAEPVLGVVDAALQVFTVESGQPVAVGRVGARPAGSLAVLAPSGRAYVMRSAAGVIEVWPVSGPGGPDRYDPDGHAVTRLGLSDDGTVVAISDDGLRVWAPGSPRAFFQHGRYTDAVVTNQNLIATGAGAIEVYRLGPGPSLIRQGSIAATRVDVSPLGKRMATPSPDGIEIWELSANDDDVVDSYRNHQRKGLLKRATGPAVLSPRSASYAWVRSTHAAHDVLADNTGKRIEGAVDCQFGSHRSYLACVTQNEELDEALEIIDAKGAVRIDTEPLTGSQFGLARVGGGDDSQVAVALRVREGTRVYIWKGGEYRSLLVPGRPQVYLVDDTHLVTLADDGQLQHWNLTSGTSESVAGGDHVLDVGFQNRDLMVAVDQAETGVVVSRFVTGAAVQTLTLPDSADIVQAVLAPQSGVLIGVSRDRGARTWTLAAPAPPIPLVTGRTGSPSTVAVGTLERHVAIGYADGGVEIWDLAHRSEVFALSTDGAAVRALVFDDAERWLAAVSDDGYARIWTLDETARNALAPGRTDAHPPLEIARMTIGSAGLHPAITFGPGPRARALATATSGGVIQRWNLDAVLDETATDIIERGLGVESALRAARDRERNTAVDVWRENARFETFESASDIDDAAGAWP